MKIVSPFYNWLIQQQKREDPVGDLARDVKRDSRFPVDQVDCEQLHGYLTHKRACSEAHCALDEAFREFASPKVSRNSLTPKIRFFIFKRDEYRCQICGATADTGARLEVDHKHPVSKGGSNELNNLWTLCFTCNRGKGVQEV